MRDVSFVGFMVLAASFVAACGVVWRAIKSLWRAIGELDRRIRKLHDLTDPNGKDKS